MALSVPSLNDLSPEEVQQTIDQLAQRLNELVPSVDRQRGVIRELVVYLSGVFGAAWGRLIENEITPYLNLDSATQASESNTAIVDLLLSNFLVTRTSGGAAKGQITIVTSVKAPVVIPRGAEFEIRGKLFTTTTSFTAKTSAGAVASVDDRLLVPTGASLFSFVIEVVAVVAGSSGNIKRGERLRPTFLIPHFHSAYATNDFSGGSDSPTNQDLITQMRQGLTAKVLTNRQSALAALRSFDSLSSIQDASIISAGDPEITRGGGLFPIANGATLDVYVRSSPLPLSTKSTKTFSRVRTDQDRSTTWRAVIGRDEASGVLWVETILPATRDPNTESGRSPSSLTRTKDTSPITGQMMPRIESDWLATFSRFQTLVIEVVLPGDYFNSIPDSVDFDVYLAKSPLISEVQEAVSSREFGIPGSDIIVRSAIPCLVHLSGTIQAPQGSNIDIDAIKTALAKEVNAYPIGVTAHSTRLAGIIHQFLPVDAFSFNLEMTGTIFMLDRPFRSVVTRDKIELQNGWPSYVSARTTAMYLDPRDIELRVIYN